MALSVFLSHAASDVAIARWVQQNLQAYSVPVYLYEDDPQPGRPLPEKLKQRIEESDFFIALLTRAAVGSPSVNQEIGIAKGTGKLIVPFLEHSVDFTKLTMLQGVEYIPFDPNGGAAGYADALRCLQRLGGQIQQRRAADGQLWALGIAGALSLVLLALLNPGTQRSA